MAECVCEHGLPAEMRTLWTDLNPAMRFYRCPQDDANACSYFEFIDPKPTLMQRSYIAKLKRERDELQNELRLKKFECSELKLSEELALDKAGLIIVEHHEMEEEIPKLRDELKNVMEELKRVKRKCWWRAVFICILLVFIVVVIV